MQPQARPMAEGTYAAGAPFSALTPRQLAVSIVVGVVFWFVAALTVQFGSAAGFFGSTASAILFAVSIPISWISVLLIKRIAGLHAGQTLPGIAVGTIAAACCDGVALTWGRGLYGTDPALVTYGAAWILWGAGLLLLFAYLDDYR